MELRLKIRSKFSYIREKDEREEKFGFLLIDEYFDRSKIFYLPNLQLYIIIRNT